MKRRINKGITLLILTAICLVLNYKKSNSVPEYSLHNSTQKDTSKIAAKVIINVGENRGRVSPLLMGFNIVYNNASDAIWQAGAGKVPKLLQTLSTGILRYPGGTVTTFYHWASPVGRGGHKDSWDPAYDSSKKSSPASMMDLDEYLAVCSILHTEPLIGINMGSGMKYNRVQDGIREAVDMMNHCIKNGGHVKYYYLDNEPYQHDANYTYTADEYADMINKYVPAMKQIDNQIKIIVNSKPIWKPLSKADITYTKTLISKAGKNIDFIDIHNYWAWSHATFEHWKSQKNMQVGSTGMTYRDQRTFYKNMAASMGYPQMDMISLEWNIGPPGKNNTPPTQAQAALMISEQFMQLIQSGMKLATLWPIAWPKPTLWSSRALLNAQDEYNPNKVYDMFKLYRDIMGEEKVKSHSSNSAIQVLSVKSANSDTLWVYLINKNPGVPVSHINLNVPGFHSKQINSIGFKAEDNTGVPLKTERLSIKELTDEDFELSMPEYSFAKLIFIR